MRFQPAVAPARHPILRSQSLAKGFPDLSKHSIAERDRLTEINICDVSISIFSSVSRTSNGIISHSSSARVIECDRLSPPPCPPLLRGGWSIISCPSLLRGGWSIISCPSLLRGG